MVKLIVNVIAISARCLRYIGFIGWISIFPNIFGVYNKIPASFELPLGGLKSIVVDSDGNIYCRAQFYSRIQVYDPEGHFLHGISSDTVGVFWIRINSDDQLEVAVARGDKRLIFDKSGKLISKRRNVPNYSEGFNTTSGHICHDIKRDVTYQIKPILLMPFLGSNVVKKDASGIETVIIRTPFLKWLFMAPFPSISFILLSLPISSIFDQKFRDNMTKALNGELVPKSLQPKY